MTLWTDSFVSYGDPCDQLSQLTNSGLRAYFELAVAPIPGSRSLEPLFKSDICPMYAIGGWREFQFELTARGKDIKESFCRHRRCKGCIALKIFRLKSRMCTQDFARRKHMQEVLWDRVISSISSCIRYKYRLQSFLQALQVQRMHCPQDFPAQKGQACAHRIARVESTCRKSCGEASFFPSAAASTISVKRASPIPPLNMKMHWLHR